MKAILRHTVSTICGFMAAMIINSPVWAQDSLAQYHPLGKGNIWIYQITHPWGNNYYERREVTGDSTIDGKQYRIIAETNSVDSGLKVSVERYDNTTGCYYTRSGSGDVLQDSTFTFTPNAGFGGKFNNRIFKSLRTETLFGARRAAREITEGNIIKEDVISWLYAYGLGLVTASDLQLVNYIPSWVQTLVYAKIDGIEYGKIPLEDEVVYPLHVGDQWAFHGLTFMNPVPSIQVVKDTLMANGVKYSVVRYGNSSEIEYQRYHADSVFIYNPSQQTETLKYRFDAQENDTISTSLYGQSFTDIILVDTSMTTIFGKRVRAFTFSIKPRGTIDATRWVTIADSLGVIDVVQGSGYESILDGAVINGVAYGTLLPKTQPYFPLSIGNLWQYRSVDPMNPMPFETRITRDTVLSNGKKYAVFSGGMLGSPYLRQEGSKLFAYDVRDSAEYVVFDYLANAKDTLSHHWKSTRTIVAGGKRTDQMSSWRCLEYMNTGGTSSYVLNDWTIRDSVGLVSFMQEPGNAWNLSGAHIDGKTIGIITGVQNEPQTVPAGVVLNQNYPNPFNPSTTISYSIPKAAWVTITVYDLLGQQVACLVNESKPSGRHQVSFNAGNMASGVYLYKIQAGTYTGLKKMLLMR